MQVMDRLLVRLMAGVLLAFLAFNEFFATALTIAYRMHAGGAAERLGRLTPGDDYRRLIPLMDAVPLWLHGLWVLAGILYLVAMAGLGRRAGWAHIPVLAAVSVEGVAHVLGRPIVAATGVVVNPHPSAMATAVIPYVLPLLLALMLWRTGRSTRASR
jgi:hypothetical protein